MHLTTRRSATVLVAMVLWATHEAPVAAQARATVTGEVRDTESREAIVGATVTLAGQARITDAVGAFEFDAVALGNHTMRVDAFGYVSVDRAVTVEADVNLVVWLRASPFSLDSLYAVTRLTDIVGRVRDTLRDIDLVDARIRTSVGTETITDSRGEFELEDVFVGSALQLSIHAFGYLAFDTAVVPETRQRFHFALRPDTLVERLVAAQVDRIEERASPRRSLFLKPMNRERLLQFAGRMTLADVLEAEYGASALRWIECVVVDERQLTGAWEPLSLTHILPEQLERIEFLGSGGVVGRRRGTMLRIYTRRFMTEMIARHVELRTPVVFGWTDADARSPVYGVPAGCI